MKRIRKCISMDLCFVMTVGLLSWMGPLKVRTATAAGGKPEWSRSSTCSNKSVNARPVFHSFHTADEK